MRFLPLIFGLSLAFQSLYGQNIQTITSAQYQQLKQAGALNPNTLYTISDPLPLAPTPPSPLGGGNASCDCYITPDGSYTQAMPPNDDSFTGLINLPFTFCFYGNNYTGLYINNNGNVTLDNPSGTFSSTGFPFSVGSAVKMIAPFWADVDTRGPGSGQVWYKITPTAIYINWDGVGYFNSQVDKRNTFQLILTNGADPVIGLGNNIQFCYKDMQWTTGSASSGVNGFGGVPATVGVNEGDGVTFSQIGRFDAPGTTYFGPYANNSQVSWLDFQEFNFNVCSSDNFPPIPVGVASRCDSVTLCVGDTIVQTVTFLSPENGQTTNVTANSTIPGFSVLNTVPGNTSTITFQIITTPASAGIGTVSLVATDDGVPAATTVYDITFNIQVNNVPPPVITGNLFACPSGTTTLDAGAGYDSYQWIPGGTGQTTNVGPGTYIVRAFQGGCSKTDTVVVVPASPYTPSVILQPAIACAPTDIIAISTAPGPVVAWLWPNGSTQATLQAPASVLVNGITVTTTDTAGCVSTSAPVNVSIDTNQVRINGPTSFCEGTSTTLTATAGMFNYAWNTGTTSSFVSITGPGTYVVTSETANGCPRSDTLVVVQDPLPTGEVSLEVVCGNTLAEFTNNFSVSTGSITGYAWSFGDGGTSNQAVPTHNYASEGLYNASVTLVTDAGCSETIAFQVPVKENPEVNIQPGAACFQKMTFTPIVNPADSIQTYQWFMGDGNQRTDSLSFIHTYQNPGNYTVSLVVIDGFGCRDSVSIPVEVDPSATLPDKLPNVISRSSTSGNDKFDLEAYSPLFNECVNYTLTIYNRWGITVFQVTNRTDNPDLTCTQCFIGQTAAGAALTEGTYFYLLEGDNQVRYQGTINVFD